MICFKTFLMVHFTYSEYRVDQEFYELPNMESRGRLDRVRVVSSSRPDLRVLQRR